MRKILEKIIHGILFTSSTVTTIAVLLIIIFLFREGAGLLGKSPIEDGFVLAVNKNNSVSLLTDKNIKDPEDTRYH